MPEKIKITKTLYVGLGGTGVKAILRTKQCFMDAYGEIPQMIGFLAIDTNQAVKQDFVLRNSGEKVTLNNNELLICSVKDPLAIYQANKAEYKWLPIQNENALSIISTDGAGQVRSNGRFIARYNAEAIKRHIASSVKKLAAPLPIGYRFEYDIDSNTGGHSATVVNIVGSIAGGTGSGMMIDILALLEETVKNIGSSSIHIYPWIVMPDVFRHQFAGPLSFNVFKNAYGALREFDYLYHLSYSNTAPLDFGFAEKTSLNKTLFSFIINNTNNKGVTMQAIDDVTDSIGRSLFLPATQVGGMVDGIMSNIRNLIVGKHYRILNKTATWAVSTGSAELVYDNKAVGHFIGYQIIKSVCDNLSSLPANHSELSNALNWMSDPNIAIQEDNKDQLIDSLCADPAGHGKISFSEDNATVDYIKQTISYSMQSNIKANYNTKLTTVQAALRAYIQEHIDTDSGVAKMQQFLDELLAAIKECEKQMQKEKEKLSEEQEPQWDAMLPSIKRDGLVAKLKGVIKEEEAEQLSDIVAGYITKLKEIERREYAINFYHAFVDYINMQKKDLGKLEANLRSLSCDITTRIKEIQNSSTKDSRFQVFLHQEDVKNIRQATQQDINDFLAANNDIKTLVGKTKTEIFDILKTWAEGTEEVRTAFNVSINEKLSRLPEKIVMEYLQRIKHMAAPMWSLDNKGLETAAKEKAHFCIIGNKNGQKNSIFDSNKGHADYDTIFSDGVVAHCYVSTNQSDRIIVLEMTCASPIYAVNGTMSYLEEFKDNEGTVGYLDNQWHQRMLSESFDVFPKKIQAVNPLQLWVKGLCLGFIHHDETTKQYWLKSPKHGDPLKKFRYNLGEVREYAFSTFESSKFYEEIKLEIDKLVKEEGTAKVLSLLHIVSADNYLSDYAHLLAYEEDNIGDEVHYGELNNQLREEINLVQAGLTIQ